MNNRKSKIFLGFYNWGTQAGLHSKLLRLRGYDVVSVVFKDQYQRIGDVHIPVPRNQFLAGICGLIWGVALFFRYFNRDVFVFYGGVSFFPRLLDLPILKLFGKKILFYYLGNDSQGWAVSIKKYKYTNMRFFIKDEEHGKAYDKRIARRLASQNKYADNKMVCVPCLSEFVPGASLLPLIIDVDNYSVIQAMDDGFIKILHAPTDRGAKGTVFIDAAIDRLIYEGYPVKKFIAEGLTHEEIKEAYGNCDLFVDQLLGGWYGTASIEAMATGKPVVCFLRPEHRDDCDYFDEIPIVNASPDDIFERLRELVKRPDRLRQIGCDSRRFVEKYHSAEYVLPMLENLLKQ